LAGEGWGEGVPFELTPHLNPLPKERGGFIFSGFVLTNMSMLICAQSAEIHFGRVPLKWVTDLSSETLSQVPI